MKTMTGEVTPKGHITARLTAWHCWLERGMDSAKATAAVCAALGDVAMARHWADEAERYHAEMTETLVALGTLRAATLTVPERVA